MADLIPTILFYVFSGIMLLSGLAVISSKNPVHSVLFLILAFINAAGLFLLLGAEYLAFTLIVVYVGAVAVLFLFVVMMLDIDFASLRQGFLKYLPAGASIAGIIFIELIMVMFQSFSQRMPKVDAPEPQVQNIRALGGVLYTEYLYPFQLAGLVLLVAMIGAIVLTLHHKPDVRRQHAGRQVSRKKSDSMMIVKVKPGEGI